MEPRIIGRVYFKTVSGARRGWRAQTGPCSRRRRKNDLEADAAAQEGGAWPRHLRREVPGGLAAWPLSMSLVAVCSGIWMRDDSSPTVIEGIIADGILRKKAGRKEEAEVSAITDHQLWNLCRVFTLNWQEFTDVKRQLGLNGASIVNYSEASEIPL